MVEVVTLGCRINSYESEILKEKFAKVDNLVIVNTCAVTKEAERQCRQTIRKLRKQNPEAKIVVTGCAAQVNPQTFAKMPEIDLILGNKEKTAIEKYLQTDLSEKTIVGDIFKYDGYDDYLITGFEGRQRAFVQVQQGCNHRCTYCIVPFARGNNRSVPQQKILEQIKTLLDQGFKEICLTGVDVCSYQPSFSDLVAAILQTFPEIPSLQFGSLDPAAIDDEFINLVGKHKNILPMFHLSIQSGDNLILKRMRRRHSREDVINLCNKVKENFINTYNLVDEAGISRLHVFPYSERPGTPAALMPQVDVEERRERAKRLREKGEVING